MLARSVFRLFAGLGPVALAGLLVLTGSSQASGGSRSPARIGRAPQHRAGSKVIGPLPGATRLTMTVTLKPRDPGGLAAYATQVSTPGSSVYHHYLTVAQFRQRFAPAASEVKAVRAQLRGRGLSAGRVSPNGLAIPVSATARSAARAFSISFKRVRLSGGRVAYANTAAPELPGSVAAAVQAILGLNSLVRAAPLGLHSPKNPGKRPGLKPRVVTGGPQPCGSAVTDATTYKAYTADQLASAYGFGHLYGAGDLGAGQTVALYELEPYSASDISTYQSCYGTSTSVSNVTVDGGAGTGAGSGEAALDIEGVLSLSPKSSIRVYEGPNTNAGVYDTYNQIVSDNVAKVISTSWGLCEASEGATAAQAESTLFQEAATQGQSIFAAAGDSGSADCGSRTLAVDDPASQPYVTGVGGTTLSALGPPPTESVWNDGKRGGAGGGGVSSLWSMPSYQSGATSSLNVINANSSGSPCQATAGSYCREVPDVSADADENTGYVVYWKGAWTAFGGTSAAAPLWAAFTALSNASSACGGKPVGFANPVIYAAAGQAYSADFNDITSGTNDVSGSGLYPAGAGYDMASGLGTPAGAGLSYGLCGVMPPPLVTLTSPAGGSAVDTSTPTLAGTAGTAAGDSATVTVNIYSGSAVSGSPIQTLAATESGGSWSIVPLRALADGTYTAQAQQTNPDTRLTGYSSANTFVVDTVAPSSSLSLSGASGAYLSGTTLYWNGNSAGGFALVDAVTDAGSGPLSVSFPAAGASGWTHGAETVTSGTGAAPTIDYTSSPYSWSAGASNPADQAITASDRAGNQTTTNLHFVQDTSGPSGGSVDARGLAGTGARYSTSSTLSIALSKGTDSQSGVAATGAQLERATASLSSSDGHANGTCGSYGAYTQLATDPTNPYTDSAGGGHCYRYEYIVPDNVGNLTTYTSPDIKVQSTAPGTLTPVVSLQNPTGNTFISGSTVYTNPQTGRAGTFEVSATASDPTSGIAGVTFPSLGAGYTGGGSVSSSPYSTTYSWSDAGAAASGSQRLQAVDNAGFSASSAFTVTPDTTAPATVTYTNGSTSSIPVSVSFQADDHGGSGVNWASGQLQRASALLSNGVCGAFGPWANLGPAGVAYSYSDSSVTAGHCYEYQYQVSDNVGNQGIPEPSGAVQVTNGGTAHQPPVARFAYSPASPATGQSVLFSATGSSDPDGQIQTYAWSFGDGATASGVSTSHTYAKPGLYTVRLSVTDNVGSVGVTTHSITVSAPPVPAPVLTLRIPRQRLRSVLKRGLKLKVSSSQAAQATLRLIVSSRNARRLHLGSGAHPVVIARLSRQLAAAETTALRLKLTRRARHRLAKVRTVRLTVKFAATGSGGKTTISRRLVLRR